jgi:phosphoribosylanthranilate isomerase
VETEIKFCGMTLPEDAREAAALGASYVGVVLASGPRRLTIEDASSVLGATPATIRRAAVFADDPAEYIADVAAALQLRVVQLHGEFAPARIEQLRTIFGSEIWSVLRLPNAALPETATAAFAIADAVLLDAHVPGKLGGTGVPLRWRELAETVQRLRSPGGARLVLAGGLRADNVSEAIRLLRPDVVDVSSGVETAPGIKDHARMRAFRDAVHANR